MHVSILPCEHVQKLMCSNLWEDPRVELAHHINVCEAVGEVLRLQRCCELCWRHRHQCFRREQAGFPINERPDSESPSHSHGVLKVAPPSLHIWSLALAVRV